MSNLLDDSGTGMRQLDDICVHLAYQARDASRVLATTPTKHKDRWLKLAADRIVEATSEVLAANAQDLKAAPQFGLTPAQTDRLRLTAARVEAMANGLRDVAALPDPIGRVRSGGVRPNGLEVLKVGVPLGVILFLYESRPNVTVDAAGLCVKSGNAVILRGGKEAAFTNARLTQILRATLEEVGLPAAAVQPVPATDRSAVGVLLKQNQCIDLVIPRGGESLIRRVTAEATMPVLKHYLGNCHVYVDSSADLTMAERIVINGKCQRPGVCNATESLIVHTAVAATFLPRMAQLLRDRGVELRGCERTREVVPDAIPATEADHAAEYLDLVLSIKVVVSLDAAIAHINQYGSKHTDAIVTTDLAAARRFVAAVDSAAVMVNASTRFNDGGELGLGAEIGISTDKFHARGPCGLEELTSYKYVVYGDGQVRE